MKITYLNPYRLRIKPWPWSWLGIFVCLAVSPPSLQSAVLVDETFSGPDGPLIEQEGTSWMHTSGSEAELRQEGGVIKLSSGQTEDLAIPLAQASYGEDSSETLFVKLSLRITDSPSTGGAYVAHFRGGGSSTYRGRLFVLADESSDNVRLAITNGASKASEGSFWQDAIALGQWQELVMSYQPSTGLTRLGVNPKQESDLIILAEDVASPKTIHQFALRQASGMGAIEIKSLMISDAFPDLDSNASKVESSLHIQPLNDSPVEFDGSVPFFEWQREGDLSQSLSLHIQWAGEAMVGEDFEFDVSHLTLEAGQAQGRAYIQPVDDILVEGNESLQATLTWALPNQPEQSMAWQATLIDDETLATASLTGIRLNHSDSAETTLDIELAGAPGELYGLEVSSDLNHWSLWQTGTLTEAIHLVQIDLEPRNMPQFFRTAWHQ